MNLQIEPQLKMFEAECRKANLRLTPQRIEIYRELAIARDHPSAELLHLRLLKKMPTLSLDTVYRFLNTFSEHGLINKIETAQSQARFEVAATPHHHLICKKCHQILDFQWQFIDQAALPDEVRQWGCIERKNLVAYGVCGRCLQGQAGKSCHITTKGDE